MAGTTTEASEMEWIKGDEVAELLGVSPNTVRSWRLRRVGPPLYRIGGAVRYDRGEVLTWLQSRHQRGDGAVHDLGE